METKRLTAEEKERRRLLRNGDPGERAARSAARAAQVAEAAERRSLEAIREVGQLSRRLDRITNVFRASLLAALPEVTNEQETER